MHRLKYSMGAAMALAAASVLAAPVPSPTTRTAASQKPIAFVSSAPRYLTLGLTEDGETCVMLAFDESEGTRRGYDMMYVIATSSNGTVRYATCSATKKTDKTHETWSFKPMTFPIVFKRGWKGGKSPFILETTYQRTRPEPRSGRHENGDDQEDFTETFLFDISLSLVNSNHWTYRVSGEFIPATSSNELEVFRLFKDEPGMTVSANRPDYESKAVGLDVAFTIGQYTIECAKDEVPVNVKLSIKNSNDVCVVTDTVASDKLTYKVVQRTGHTVRSSGGG